METEYDFRSDFSDDEVYGERCRIDFCENRDKDMNFVAGRCNEHQEEDIKGFED